MFLCFVLGGLVISSEDLLTSFHMDGRNLHAKVVTWRSCHLWWSLGFGRIYLGSLYMWYTYIRQIYYIAFIYLRVRGKYSWRLSKDMTMVRGNDMGMIVSRLLNIAESHFRFNTPFNALYYQTIPSLNIHRLIPHPPKESCIFQLPTSLNFQGVFFHQFLGWV